MNFNNQYYNRKLVAELYDFDTKFGSEPTTDDDWVFSELLSKEFNWKPTPTPLKPRPLVCKYSFAGRGTHLLLSFSILRFNIIQQKKR